ncbi:MAG: twin-arginine translocase TatA/TatE family subunit [Proteobacteria bacterium]|nr:twin-arginine translocase TatA/TatE family subunit [Pseudomonadota bacterium]
MERPGFWSILIIAVLVLVLFGHAKIPEMAKNIANGINVFKKELKKDDDDKDADAAPTAKAKKPAAKQAAKLPAKKVAKKKK